MIFGEEGLIHDMSEKKKECLLKFIVFVADVHFVGVGWCDSLSRHTKNYSSYLVRSSDFFRCFNVRNQHGMDSEASSENCDHFYIGMAAWTILYIVIRYEFP